jgi:hypothetical protein
MRRYCGPMPGPQQPTTVLEVRFLNRQIATLHPEDPPFTFGRGRDRTLRVGHNSLNGGPDLDISRHVGSIRCGEGLWVVCNDSNSRPFDIIVRGVSNPLSPRTTADSHSRWAISPPGLEIRVAAPSGRYLLSVNLDAPSPSTQSIPRNSDPYTVPLREPTDYERLLLAAKFLALQNPGDAVGNREAAEYASVVLPHDRPASERAIDNCVAKWCRRLQELGVTDINGRDNINQLGRQLLAWGLLRQEDRKLLYPTQGMRRSANGA